MSSGGAYDGGARLSDSKCDSCERRAWRGGVGWGGGEGCPSLCASEQTGACATTRLCAVIAARSMSAKVESAPACRGCCIVGVWRTCRCLAAIAETSRTALRWRRPRRRRPRCNGRCLHWRRCRSLNQRGVLRHLRRPGLGLCRRLGRLRCHLRFRPRPRPRRLGHRLVRELLRRLLCRRLRLGVLLRRLRRRLLLRRLGWRRSRRLGRRRP